jgi:hypothetical protein
MPLVKYIATPSPDDRTEELRLATKDGQARVAILGGDAVEMSDSEFYSLTANGYGLEAVGSKAQESESETAAPAPVAPTPPQSPAASTQTAPPGA